MLPSVIGSPGGCFGLAMTSCLARKKKPSLQGWASLGRNGPEGGIVRPRTTISGYAASPVGGCDWDHAWTLSPKKKSAAQDDCAQFFFRFLSGPLARGLGGLAVDRTQSQFLPPAFGSTFS